MLNTQRPVHQLWLAGGQSAWHFSFDEASARWLDDKGRGELFEVLRALTRDVFDPATTRPETSASHLRAAQVEFLTFACGAR